MTTASSRDFLNVIFKRKTIIILFLLISVLLAAVTSLLSEPIYEANAKIMVKIGRENIYNPGGDGQKILFTPNKEEQINSEIEILKSQTLFTQVVESLGADNIYDHISNSNGLLLDYFFSDPEDVDETPTNTTAILKLQEDTHVEKVPRSDVIQVSFLHTDPNIAAQVINTWIDYFLDSHLEIHENSQSLEYYRKQSDIMRIKLDEAKLKQSNFMKQYNISIEPKDERNLLMKQLSSLRVDLNKARNQEAGVKSRIQSIHFQLNKANKNIALNEKIGRRANKKNTLLTQLAGLKRQETSLLVDHSQHDLQVQQIRTKIASINVQIKEQDSISHLVPQVGSDKIQQKLQESLSLNEIEVNALRALKQVQATALETIQAKIEQVSKIETEYGDYKLKVALTLKNYHSYLSKLEGSRMSGEMNKEKISNVRLINPAQPPLVPISPNIPLNLILSLFIGVIGGFMLAFFLEYLDDSIDSEEDVEHFLDLPVLALIPIHKDANIMRPSIDQYLKIESWPQIGVKIEQKA